VVDQIVASGAQSLNVLLARAPDIVHDRYFMIPKGI
jgi:hypothetical protein